MGSETIGARCATHQAIYLTGHISNRRFYLEISFLEHLLIRNTAPRHSQSCILERHAADETFMISHASLNFLFQKMFVRCLWINMMLKSERNNTKKEMKGILDVKAPKKKTCTSALK